MDQPYQPPKAPQPPQPSQGAASSLTPSTIADVGTLSTWLMIMSIVTFVGLLVGVVGLVTMLGGPMYGPFLIGLVVTLVQIIFGVLSAIFLLQAANGYRSYVGSHNPFDLERGLKAQKNFFIVFGVQVILMIAFILLTVIATMMGGMGRMF